MRGAGASAVWRRWGASAGGLALLVGAGSAAAQAPADARLELRWEAPRECPQAEQVRGQVRALLRASRSQERRDRVVAEVSVARAEAGYAASLRLRGEAGEVVRELASPRCDAVVEAAALLIAFALDPLTLGDPPEEVSAQATPAEPPEASAPSTPAEPEAGSGLPLEPMPPPPLLEAGPTVDPGPAASPPPLVEDAVDDGDGDDDAPEAELGAGAPPPPPPRRLAGVVWAAPGAAFAGLPGVGLELAGGVGLVGPRWRADLVGGAWLPREVTAAADPRARGRLWLWSIAARGGLLLRPRRAPRIQAPLLLGIEVGEVRGRGEGLDVPREAARPFVGARADAGVEVEIERRVALWASAGLLIPFLRPTFAVTTGAGGANPRVVEVATLGAAVARLQAGIIVRFP